MTPLFYSHKRRRFGTLIYSVETAQLHSREVLEDKDIRSLTQPLNLQPHKLEDGNRNAGMLQAEEDSDQPLMATKWHKNGCMSL